MRGREPRFDNDIESALAYYDRRKGLRRSVFGDHPAISALRNLPPADRKDYYKLYMCFHNNIPKHRTASREVYKVVINTIKQRLIIGSNEIPMHYVSVLRRLGDLDMLTRNNFDKVMLLHKHFELNGLLNRLSEVGLLTRINLGNIIDITNRDNFFYMLVTLEYLYNENLLTPSNFNAVWGRIENKAFYSALNKLVNHIPITQEIFNCIVRQPNHRNCNSSIFQLRAANILTLANLSTIFNQNQESENISSSLRSLVQANLLTQQNFNSVMPIANISPGVPAVLHRLRLCNLLNQANYDHYISSNDIVSASYAIFKMHNCQILNQHNLNVLFNPANSFLLSRDARQLIWQCILDEFLTQDIFERILEHCDRLNELNQLANAEFTIREYLLAQIFGVYEDQDPAQNHVLNYAQSTHNADVERTVSESAVRLRERYTDILDDKTMKTILGQIISYINTLSDDTVQNRAAKRCIARVTGEMFTYIEPSSGIPFRQLLILAWVAIHDIAKQKSENITEALQPFVNGLHEIQRGGNLSDTGVDPGDETDHPDFNANDEDEVSEYIDKPICAGGTFNKIMEKLAGIHPDCQIEFITLETVGLKMQVVVNEELKAYLQTLNNPHAVIDNIKENGIEVIWGKIHEVIANRIFSEFSSKFPGRDSQEFTAFIDSGKYSSLPVLDNFNPATKSPGSLRHTALFSGDQKPTDSTSSKPVNNSNIK